MSTQKIREVPVLVIGGGPAGATLAADLGWRGAGCLLVDETDGTNQHPRANMAGQRSMEIFRRWGLADRMLAASLPFDYPIDVIFSTRLNGFEITRFSLGSTAAFQTAAVKIPDIAWSPYFKTQIGQNFIEPVVCEFARSCANVEVRHNWRLVSFTQDASGVTAEIEKTDGSARETVRAQYMVGCDGGSSPVRKQLGFRMEGEPNILEMRQALFHCPELFDKVKVPRARHYNRIDGTWTLMIVQDSRKHFTLHAVVEKDEDMAALFEAIVGTPVKYEMVHCAKWMQRLLLAEHYSQGRVFLAGDSVHLVIPTGGLGMNTGVGDAIDVSWKLAATLQGWGGLKLLGSYEAERRPVGARNVEASGGGTTGRMKWRDLYRPNIEDDTPEGRAALANLLEVAREEAPKSFRVLGAELGYRYAGSPVICDEPGGPVHKIESYEPTSWPGARLPHVWLKPGEVSVHDRIKDGYTLLRVGKTKADASGLQKVFGEIGAPFSVLDLDGEAPRQVYGFDYLLVRPDLHVVWRGNALPEHPDQVARVVTGH